MDKDLEKPDAYFHDSFITGLIKIEFLTSLELKDFQINVITTNGIVYLGGVLGTQQNIEKCQEIVRSVHGVKSVKCNLSVKQICEFKLE